jgi:aspartate/methionine/tyrosine aminotransferase
LDALSPLGANAVKGGQGAIYLWAKLPSGASDDVEVVKWLAKRHGVIVIPGSASGGPGYVRVSFGPRECFLLNFPGRKISTILFKMCIL